MKIKKISLSILSRVTILCWLLPTLVQAYPSTPLNPLQYYDDQIKKAQKEALDSLATSMATTESTPSLPSSQTLPTPPEHAQRTSPSNNADKAFAVPSAPTTRQGREAQHNAPPSPTAANPWLKPNPWAEQAKQNPWANAPIPQPAAPGFTPPPNIFAPPNASNPQKPNPNHG